MPATTTHYFLPYPFARRYGLVLLEDSTDANKMCLCIREDCSPLALLEARRALGKAPISVQFLNAENFATVLAGVYENSAGQNLELIESMEQDIDLTHLAETMPEHTDLLESNNDAPIIRLINALLIEAIRQNASDIHIEPYEKQLTVRYRVDGVLRQVVQLKRTLAPMLISRVKVMAKLDIAEKRIPQDGHIPLTMGGHDFDIRVSTIPSGTGERVVLRLLNKQSAGSTLESLHLSDRDFKTLQGILNQPNGIMLVTGPTGSGKTTTLYAGLRALSDSDHSILTIEDPVEIALEGIGQTQVNPKVDMTFARGLRAILRQDPDIIMVGEIRDLETAQIAVQASLTGHLVLSTLHTNSAIGAITRLQDMGIEPFLLASSLCGLVAQRLVRKLCPQCKQAYVPTGRELEALGMEYQGECILYRANGCEECKQSGYSGRLGVYEVIRVDDHLRALIHDSRGEAAYEACVRLHNPSILNDAAQKVAAGLTSVDEVLRILSS